MSGGTDDLLQGTLDLLILKTLGLGPNHGLGIARRINQITKGTFHPKPGSLFPALHRLEEKGWLASEWGESENRRKSKYYKLTRLGRRHLEAEIANWERVAGAIFLALETTS
ncbi:MAG TPA: PadR family transcriptional regulator [Blastocatellia bacterium]|jgi:transcriptional regulator|nr:PadR family transcriptional regulator [Blastocatellia bacterium]